MVQATLSAPKSVNATKKEHKKTLVFGGLSSVHDDIFLSTFLSFGYKAEKMPTPNLADFQAGKEFGNYGQCNPTYFTSGNLVNYLKSLEKRGLTKEEIVDNYFFLGATSPCGPCRLGMYQEEYKLSTTNAGFANFKIKAIGFEDSVGGADKCDEDFNLNIDLICCMILSILIGDILVQVRYRIAPYEKNPGETQEVLKKSLKYIKEVLESPKEIPADRSQWFSIFGGKAKQTVSYLEKIYHFFQGAHMERLTDAFETIGKWFSEIQIDPTIVKPIVKISGEFWAKTTDGDGNFNMYRFLEEQGAEVYPDPISVHLFFLLHEAKENNEKYGMSSDKKSFEINMFNQFLQKVKQKKDGLLIAGIEKLLANVFDKLRSPFRNFVRDIPDFNKIFEYARPYYNTELQGGEGCMEVGKNIYYHQKKLVHMVLSVKPFGCMPSTQSDAVQGAVQGAYGDILFLPIETSGEGEVSALSRVQMMLSEAKKKTKNELDKVLKDAGTTLDKVSSAIESKLGKKITAASLKNYDSNHVSQAAKWVSFSQQ